MSKRVVSERALAGLLRYRALKAHYRDDSIGGQMTYEEIDKWIARSNGHSKKEARWLYEQSWYIDRRGWDDWWVKTDGPAGYENEKD
jgi:hypothetical protein